VATTPVFLSNSRYNLLRSYVRGAVVRDSGVSSWNLTGRRLTWTTGIYTVAGDFSEAFYPWSSNYYTLDYCWDFDSFQLWVSGVPYYGSWGVFFFLDLVEEKSGFWLGLSLFSPVSAYTFAALPAQPSDYWLPSPLA